MGKTNGTIGPFILINRHCPYCFGEFVSCRPVMKDIFTKVLIGKCGNCDCESEMEHINMAEIKRLKIEEDHRIELVKKAIGDPTSQSWFLYPADEKVEIIRPGINPFDGKPLVKRSIYANVDEYGNPKNPLGKPLRIETRGGMSFRRKKKKRKNRYSSEPKPRTPLRMGRD